MHQLDVALESRRDRVRQSTDGSFAGLRMSESVEVSIEELVGLADGNLDREPIASRGDGGCLQVVIREPLVDNVDGVLSGLNKGLNLEECPSLNDRRYDSHKSAYLFLGQVLTVAGARGVADGVELRFQTLDVGLNQSDTEVKHLRGGSSAVLDETVGNGGALVHNHVAEQRVSSLRDSEKGSDDESDGDHLGP